MKVQYRHIIFILPILLCIGFTTFVLQEEKAVTATLITKPKFYTAGEVVQCEFLLTLPVLTQLHIQSAYGSTVLFSEVVAKEVVFNIPRYIVKKRGVVNYTLFHNGEVLDTGIYTVHPNPKTTLQLETYIGPPSIIAGGVDYTMQVEIPTDGFDNPLAEETPVFLNHQFLDIERSEVVPIKNMIAWKNIYSYIPSGRMLLSSTVHDVTAKEFAIDVFAAQPVSFQIKANRKHHYADGNQITELSTTIIRDQYGNVVTDGTWVSFIINPSNGMQLQTGGTTINGIATAKILHPDHKEQWRIKAFVTGMASSAEIMIQYRPVLETYPVQFSEDHRHVTIGPILSFMKQLIPDGATVRLKIDSESRASETKIKTSNNGKVTFVLSEDFYPSGQYTFTITVLGVTQEFKNVRL